jgi:nitrogenase molybdenum-iron protein alpha/beta subunit
MNEPTTPPASDAARLEHYRLKSQDLGQLTGVAMALHAVPDTFLLKHIGVGCKHKTVTQFSTHDWGRGLASHEAWTEVGDASVIRGSAVRIGPYVRSSYTRHKPTILGVVSVTFLDLTGDDYAAVTAEAGVDLEGTQVVYFKCPGFEGDVYSGYLSATLDLVKLMDWSVTPDLPTSVAMVGYLWDRYEGDHQGNLAQIGALVKGLGLELGPVLFSGAPFTDLRAAPRSGVMLQLPYAAPKAKALKRAMKRELAPVDLPIGFRGTTAFLRALGRAARLPEARVDAFARKQEEAVRGKLGAMTDRLRGYRVAVFADLPLAVGVVSLLDELGLSVEVVGLRGRTLGGEAAFREALARVGATLPEGCEVLEDPSLHRVRDVTERLWRARRLDGVLGSATDLNAVTTIPASAFLAPLAGEQMFGNGPFKLEIGFPCKEHHCTYAMPFMGYGGVMMWVQRLLSAPRLWDAGRNVRQ